MRQAPSRDEVRRVTEAVLERPEFQDSGISLWDRTLSWFFSVLPAWAEANPGLARIVMILLTILLVLLLAHIAYTVIHEFAVHRKEPASTRGRRRFLQALEEVGAENWAEAFGMAKTALADKDVYRALWITHRILLSVLDRMERIRFARWKTNSDYLSECKAGGSGAGTLAKVTQAYEEVIYAHRSLSATDVAGLLEEVELLAGDHRR